jgi:hypothetical protein
MQMYPLEKTSARFHTGYEARRVSALFGYGGFGKVVQRRHRQPTSST